MGNKKKCYVIMPFSKTESCSEGEWTEIFEHVIKPAVKESELGYECVRSRAKRENIIKGIVNDLNTAQVVIADLTDSNPNVFYELGVRHTLKNRTILIAQDEKFIPSDLSLYPTVTYNHQSPAAVSKFKQEIKEGLEDIETNPERSDNPVADFLTERNIVLLSSEKKSNLARLCALVSELSQDVEAVDDVIRSIKASEERQKEGKGGSVSNVRFDVGCLELLLTTSYLALPQQLLERTGGITNKLRKTNVRLDLWQHTKFAKSVEESLGETLPQLKDELISLLSEVSKVTIDYANDNYVEPKEPTIFLSSLEHRKYFEAAGELTT